MTDLLDKTLGQLDEHFSGERVLVDFKTFIYPGPHEMNDTTWKESKHEGIGVYRLMTRPRWQTAFLSFRKVGKKELRTIIHWDGCLCDEDALKKLTEMAQNDLDTLSGYSLPQRKASITMIDEEIEQKPSNLRFLPRR